MLAGQTKLAAKVAKAALKRKRTLPASSTHPHRSTYHATRANAECRTNIAPISQCNHIINPENLENILQPGKEFQVAVVLVHIKCIAACNHVPV